MHRFHELQKKILKSNVCKQMLQTQTLSDLDRGPNKGTENM